MNVFNGGLHALRDGETLGQDRISLQEIMVVPVGALNYRDALITCDRIDSTLHEVLQMRYGAARVSRGDEAGFTVQGLGDHDVAIAHVIEAVERAGYLPGKEIKLAIDAAAGTFFDKNQRVYHVGGQSLDGPGMINFWRELVHRHADRIFSIEDGLEEDDWPGWATWSEAMDQAGVLTVGDDLFVSQIRRLRRGINNRSARAVLVKVNQNGSMIGAMDAMAYAREHGMKCIISHRSGETLDTSIADMACGLGALGLKSGAPQPEDAFPDPRARVRRVKYQRMVQLEESGAV
jgi:enolase